jgi:hypothetical protein
VEAPSSESAEDCLDCGFSAGWTVSTPLFKQGSL